MRHGEGDGLGDGRVPCEDFIDLRRGDLLASAIDDLFEPARKEEVAISIEAALVTRSKPAVSERDPVSGWIILVTSRDICATDHDLAGFTHGKQVASIIHNGDIRPRRDPNRTRLPR